MRHPLATIEKIKTMRRQGFTLTEIMVETNLGKTTVFHHIKNIATSDEFKASMLVANLAKIKRMADNRRGRSFKTYPHWEPTEWSPGFVNLVAHFMFDGEIRKTSLVYNNRSQALINNVISLMEELIGVSDYILYTDKNGVTRASYHNVEITNFVRQKEEELLDHIVGAPDDEKIAFLKAFYDDEGNVSFAGKHKLVRGYQHSVPILELVQKLLADFGIASRIQAKFFEIDISRKADVIKFRDLINFSEGVCVNGLRSNSVWRESLEKREILNRMISSYHEC